MDRWPALPLEGWQGTRDALHLMAQVVGKYRLARTPWVPHSWHAALYAVPEGLTTGPVPDAGGQVTVTFDIEAQRLAVRCSSGQREDFDLEPMSIARFDAQLTEAIRAVGGDPARHGAPNEVEDAIPFAQDAEDRPWDAGAVRRFHRAALTITEVFAHHRTGFLGKASPAHLFWGSFDLAVTRFSGRPAPPHPGGIPNLPDAITREAYSHEVQSSGWWTGGGPCNDAAFYAYAYPKPEGFEGADLGQDAFWSEEAGEFVLPYEAVRRSGDPDARLLAFLDVAYDAAADLGGWDRKALDCARGRPGVVRPVPA